MIIYYTVERKSQRDGENSENVSAINIMHTSSIIHHFNKSRQMSAELNIGSES